jgi:hypothetical protein
MCDKPLQKNGKCVRKLTLKNQWKVSHLHKVENLLRNQSNGNPNMKDARFITHKPFLMMLE